MEVTLESFKLSSPFIQLQKEFEPLEYEPLSHGDYSFSVKRKFQAERQSKEDLNNSINPNFKAFPKSLGEEQTLAPQKGLQINKDYNVVVEPVKSNKITKTSTKREALIHAPAADEKNNKFKANKTISEENLNNKLPEAAKSNIKSSSSGNKIDIITLSDSSEDEADVNKRQLYSKTTSKKKDKIDEEPKPRKQRKLGNTND